jgi:xanthine/CO dehydrogenase XdhC/CoxF family maturation factor
LSKEALDQVYVTIGIEINSELLEEIAVSIVAELIQGREESIS